jgi:tetratricopeptide (TPR) repeat protein
LAVVAYTALPSTADAAPSLGDVQKAFHSGDYETAARLSTEAVEAGIWNERWPRWLIRCQLMTGNYDEAIKTYQKVINRYPTSLTLRHLGIEALRRGGKSDLAKKEEAQFFRILQSSPSRFTSPDNLIAAGRYFLDQGEDARQVLKMFYDRVRDANPRYVEAYIATAELAIEKGDYQVAADTLVRAEQFDQIDARIPYLTARAWDPSDSAKANAAVEKALQLNANHIPSLLYRAHNAIDGERYKLANKIIEQVQQVNPRHPESIALQAVLAHLEGDYEQEQSYRTAALATWAENPLVDHAIGKKLSEKYRFAEGVKYQRKALEFDSDYTPAQFQLAQDLLRLGDDTEGWKIAEQVADEDEYNVVAHNLITLYDRLKDFSILESDGIAIRMDAHEAQIYGQDALELLTEAKRVLCEKYDVQPNAPIVVEIFPEQKDFAIRTFGLPGGAGFLGVCFGRVITANSPASQGERPSNWKSVLWHEFCHVVTLEKTKNRMPRWLSEGISVYEERQRDSSWGESITPTYREMLLAEDLIPVSDLSAAFLRPPSPVHLQFAYFHSSLVVEYLIDQHGIDALKAILDDLGNGLTINAALERSVGSIEKLDVQFAEYVRKVASDFGSQADWSREEMPESLTAEELESWISERPNSYWGLRSMAKMYLASGQFEDAKTLLEKLHSLGTATGDREGLLEMLASVHNKLGETEQEKERLEELITLSNDALPALRRLTDLAQEQQQWDQTLNYAEKILAIQPLLPGVHVVIATAADELNRPEQVAGALRALRSMDPVDPAAIDYRLAKALVELEQYDEAKHHVLMALDEAPRYRDAHRLLLQIVERTGGGKDQNGD